MTTPEYYTQDLLAYFEGRPMELALYEKLFHRLEVLCPECRVKVQKTQISFYCEHLFAAVSLPLRRRRGWPEHCLVVTVGLGYPLDSPRVAEQVEPYPNRWTNHILVAREDEIDGELLAWLEQARLFAREKQHRRC